MTGTLKSASTSLKHFQFMDGYRGLAALSVLSQHAEEHFGSKHVLFNGFMFGVPAFFQLSAFLLTYRLLVQYDRRTTADDASSLILATLKYAVTRFCRIYVTLVGFLLYQYVVYWLLDPTDARLNVRLMNGLLLDGYLLTEDIVTFHLWTIPIEIQFYYVIPIIAFVMSRIQSKWHVCVCSVLTLTYFAYVLHWQGSEVLGESIEHSTATLRECFPVFFMGSLVAFVYKRVEDRKITILNKFASFGLGCLSLIFQCVAIRVPFAMQPTLLNYYLNGLFLALHLFVMLIGSANFFTSQMLGGNLALRLMGKYSFGTYLFHVVVVTNIEQVPFVSERLLVDKVLISIGLTCVVAFVFYHAVEKNALRLAAYVNRQLETIGYF